MWCVLFVELLLLTISLISIDNTLAIDFYDLSATTATGETLHFAQLKGKVCRIACCTIVYGREI
jgi:hypothetical protein